MNPAAYIEMAQTESRHWWFCARRSIIEKMILGIKLPINAKLLEVGSGTGGNLNMLAEFGEVSALEMDATAREIACKNTDDKYKISNGHCPDNIPFVEERFDLICMFDVLEHIDQDVEALISLKRLLTKSGKIIITVPAYQWLYGGHDEFLHHKRRYSATQLRKVIKAAGFKQTKMSYFNTILFPIAVLARLKDKLTNNLSVTGTSIPPVFINELFRVTFSLEVFLLRKVNLPFGVSLLCILEAQDEA